MKHITQDLIQQTTQSAKIAAATSTATAGSGLATWLEFIPTDIGKLATLIGLILSTVLIYTHLKKNSREKERHEMEMKILEKKLNETKG